MSDQHTGPAEFDLAQFLIKDYELKVTFFTNHLTRMWTRFTMFVTLQSALVAVLIVQGSLSNVAAQIAAVEAVISVIWFMIGRHDLCLIRIYRDRITHAAKALVPLGLPSDYRTVIELTPTPGSSRGYRLFEAAAAHDVPRLPAALPALLILGWAALLTAILIA